eukprot:CAMPEP_0170633508 /NCGR_PEP_ID=MMETSP0224-20130122/36039_1 /TAXON_ID=285029 /ORGANISM="Togula jolla, Strain CCCM 725" /LENGTH=474 /DNA_ID=CAMNT_0010962573 /DNA_START=41 /DNA_END=1465 /DNA_ORIENTATION=-
MEVAAPCGLGLKRIAGTSHSVPVTRIGRGHGAHAHRHPLPRSRAATAAASAAAAVGTVAAIGQRMGRRREPSARLSSYPPEFSVGTTTSPATTASSASAVSAPLAPPGDRRVGVLLLNIGTPASTSVEDVRSYLKLFLADDRVIEIKPPLLKSLLLEVLLATRPAASAKNYQKIWDPERGSPLLFHTQDLTAGLQEELGPNYLVRIGMAYSEPFVSDALRSIADSGVDEVVLVPMFPHFASSTTGSILANAYRTCADLFCTPFIRVIPPFYSNESYLSAMTAVITESVGHRGDDVDHVLFSFHGVPEAQCTQTDDSGEFCLKQPGCCARMNVVNRNCYRAQCFETARLLVQRLELPDDKWSVAFQSRLTLRGTIQWIRPYTDEAIVDLARHGKHRVGIVAPSFTADCVETLEELGITGREEFEEAGGKDLVLVPCLNSSDDWVRSLSQIIREQLAGAPRIAASTAQGLAVAEGL